MTDKTTTVERGRIEAMRVAILHANTASPDWRGQLFSRICDIAALSEQPAPDVWAMLAQTFETLFYISETSDDEATSKAAKQVADEIEAVLSKASEQPARDSVVEALPDDVRRLVIAAREVAYEANPSSEAKRELDQAAEAFASRVPWENEDEDEG